MTFEFNDEAANDGRCLVGLPILAAVPLPLNYQYRESRTCDAFGPGVLEVLPKHFIQTPIVENTFPIMENWVPLEPGGLRATEEIDEKDMDEGTPSLRA